MTLRFKPALSFKEQLELMKSRGLIVKRMVCKEEQWIEIMLKLDELIKRYKQTIKDGNFPK